MEATAPEENMIPAGKASAEIAHTERIVDEKLKSAVPSLTRAQIRRFTAVCDLRVLPMLGVIYAVSILDRINVHSASTTMVNKWPTDERYRSAQRKCWGWKKISVSMMVLDILSS